MVLFTLLVTLAAWAGDPQIDVEADGRVVGRVTVDATASEVRTLVDDPVRCLSLSPDIVSIESQPGTKDCFDVVAETRGLFRPLRYRSRRCATSDGWQDRLLESDDFQTYESDWSVREVDGGTEVTLKVKTEVDLPVPQSIIEKRSKKSVGEILENLVRQILH